MKFSDLAAGVQIGDKYRLVEILGRGGYGDVWRAERLADDVSVAVKFYRDPERSWGVLGREAQLARDFDHENVVRVYSAEPIEGLYCMEMEYVPGVAMSHRIAKKSDQAPPTLDEVLSWMEQVAAGLQYLHQRVSAISHGDIKLDNLLLTPDGTVKITDFGLSRVDSGEKFAPSDLGGTWLYMAPERLGLEREPSHCESDIYSFGVTFYRVLTGRFPRETAGEVYTLAPFPRPCELNSAIPAEVDLLICRCLEKSPEARFADGTELVSTIREIKRELQVPNSEVVPVGGGATLISSDGPYRKIELAYQLAHSGDAEGALRCLNSAILSISTNPQILEFYADLNRRAGRAEIARSSFERIVGWFDAHGVPLSERRDVLVQLGELQIGEKKYEEAVATYGELTQAFENDVWIKSRYGIALGLASQPRESVRILEEVRSMRPTSALICAKIGFAYLQMKNKAQAEQYFNEALMLDEHEPTALYHLAILCFIDGFPGRAERYHRRLCGIEGQEAKARDLAKKMGLA